MNRSFIPVCLAAACSICTAHAEVKFPWKDPGKAKIEYAGNSATLSNKMFSAAFRKAGKGVVFGGMKMSNGKEVAQNGTNLFTIKLADGTTYTSKDMNSSELEEIKLKPNKKNPRLSEKIPGVAVGCTFTAPDKSFEIIWRAVLRNSSHYLRQEMQIKAHKNVAFDTLTPVLYNITAGGTPQLMGGVTHGKLVLNDLIFCGLETPMSLMSAPGGSADTAADEWTPESWSASALGSTFSVPPSLEAKYGNRYAETDGPVVVGIGSFEGPVSFAKGGDCKIQLSGGLNAIAVQLLQADGNKVISEDVHKATEDSTYHLNVPSAGMHMVKIWVDTKDKKISGSGSIKYSLPLAKNESAGNSAGPASLVQGDWVRRTTLQSGQSWKTASVLGFFAPQQQRRSFLAYLDRERAVPYRLFIHYNDWYEIGITRNFKDKIEERNSESIQVGILEDWRREMIQKRKTPIDCFVIDDGWDDFNTLWDFHSGFPNGFSRLAKILKGMKSSIGTWLGPVGGYGNARNRRIEFWNRTHPKNQIGAFQLSNKEYFDAFVGRCSQMIRDYNMSYFKFDGISGIPHAKGPAALEDAEGILSVIAELRKARPDVYINTTVGTWSSPFWLMHSDTVWRQENDHGLISEAPGDPRDKWMTYRDRLIHEVFVKRFPFYPLCSVMSHGIIITENGPPHVMSKDPENCIKEIRSHIGCGTNLQELYIDRSILNKENGRLWDELAAAIKWLRRNEDVLADVHWVGGNPWDKENQVAELYGWAAWTPSRCTLTLRNPSDSRQELTSTLRQILDIPPMVKKEKVKFRNSFDDQRVLGVLVGKSVNVDKEITISLEPQEVIVLEGICENGMKEAKEKAENGEDEADNDDNSSKSKKKGKKKKKKSRKGRR